jgi:PAS domain S-box-containing protein
VARAQLRSYAVILGIFVLLLVIALTSSWAAIELVNSTRSYAAGEGRYSKAEKMAVLDLHRYAYSRNPNDYNAFLNDVALPRGDHMARLALSRSPPDIESATEGFLRGHNHPSDIPGMIRLFRWFSWWQPFAAAKNDWRAGDHLVDQLIAQGMLLHQQDIEGRLDDRSRAASLGRIDTIDDRLTVLENTFTTHLGDASRMATALVVLGLGLTTIVLWAIGIAFAIRLFRRQSALDRQLASSERRFRDYAEVASDWYWEMDSANRVTYLSDRFFMIANMPTDGALGRSGANIIRDNSEDGEHRDQCLLAIAEQRPFRGLRLRFPMTDGTASFWSVSGKPHVNEAGEFLGYRGVGADITSQVNDAQTLTDAKTRAEVANLAKSEFLANMSHELRTPLNAILGFSDIIERRMFGADAIDRYADYAHDIHESGTHLLLIINEILDLSKIEAGREVLHESEKRLDELVAELRVLLGDQADKAGVAFHVAMPAPSPLLYVDGRKFIQIFLNLLSNAFKFTPSGGSVTLQAAVERDGGLTMIVRDTGIGIAAEDLESVLAPFGQVESAFSRQHHGTGLGLPLAKALAELHGGTLAIESAVGVGTTVTVSLPSSRVLGTSPLALTADAAK